MKPERDQTSLWDDELSEFYGQLSGVDCSQDVDTARQEFKDECDLNSILRKYGALPPVPPITQAEVDYDLDLLTSRMARSEALEAYQAFPRALREKLNFDGFLRAVANGSFKISKADSGAAAPAASASASASESAPAKG